MGSVKVMKTSSPRDQTTHEKENANVISNSLVVRFSDVSPHKTRLPPLHDQ
jgi:hypothetical protein